MHTTSDRVDVFVVGPIEGGASEHYRFRLVMRFEPLRLLTEAESRRYALLINPFYSKDPHASFGKHVLTPSLALTSVAASTPSDWDVSYWDENLLQGAPPSDPLPAVVGITVHLTFAHRAYELARWYGERGAIVVLGGLHVISCPDDAAPHADALAIGEAARTTAKVVPSAAATDLEVLLFNIGVSPSYWI